MRTSVYISMILLVCVTAFSGPSNAFAAPSHQDSTSLLLNGGFEQGNFSLTASPDNWAQNAYDPSAVFQWDNTQAYEGSRSVKITAETPNDASWLQTVSVQPNTLYRLSGWIKTENVAHSGQIVDKGASLSLSGTWDSSMSLFGTNDWTYVSLRFNSGEQTEVTLAARLGFWAGTTSGTAWFDNLALVPVPIQPSNVHPNWKILVLIYDKTDFTYTDLSGIPHHYVSMMTQADKDQAERVVTKFVNEDIPTLDSGNMIPTLTIRHPERALTELSPMDSAWWPSPEDLTTDRDPAFDSVIVIWDPWVVDQTTGETSGLAGPWAGLTPGMGTGQTYAAIILDAVWYGHPNVFKHEWGHSITAFYDALGVAPKPGVDVHIDLQNPQYVHCPSGEPYDLVDETDTNPIPNSIYNNDSGFTHDYYSGTVALADQPTRCLGITPEAWAYGGPVSEPVESLSPLQELQSIRDKVDQLVLQGDLAKTRANSLYAKLDVANKALEEARDKRAVKSLQLFVNKVEGLIKAERLPEVEGQRLIDQATALLDQLKK